MPAAEIGVFGWSARANPEDLGLQDQCLAFRPPTANAALPYNSFYDTS
jgi:hypothetical protein